MLRDDALVGFPTRADGRSMPVPFVSRASEEGVSGSGDTILNSFGSKDILLT